MTKEELNITPDEDTYPVVVELIDGLGQVITQLVVAAKYTEARGDEPRGVQFPPMKMTDDLCIDEERRVELARQGGTLRIWPTDGYMDIPLEGPLWAHDGEHRGPE